MFSCCLPVSRGQDRERGLNERGSDENIFRRARRWIRNQSRQRLWPIARREPESSTQVTEDHQQVDEDPGPAFTTEGQLGHSTEVQQRPKVHMASSGSGKPGLFSARRWSPPQKPIRFRRPPSWKLLNQQRRIALRNSFLESPTFRQRFPMCDAYLQHQAWVNHTGPEDLQPQGAEPKAPAQEAEEAPAETLEVQTESSDEGSDEELEAWAPPGVQPPPSASPVAAVEPGPAWEAPADKTETPCPLDEEPSLEPALSVLQSQSQGLKRGSDDTRFRIGRHWFRTPCRSLSPLTQLEPESSTGHRQVDEDPSPAFTSEGQLGHSTERQQRPKVHFASCGSGEPGPSSDWRSPPTKKPTRSWKPPTLNQRQDSVLSSILDPIFKPLLESPKLSRKFPAFNYLRPKAHGIYTGPDYLVPEEAEHKAWAQEAEQAPAETPEVQTESSDEESDEELEAWAPPEVQPPPSASPMAAVEPGPAWEAPADKTEAPPPLDEEPSLEPAQGPASEEELPPETPAELLAETAGLLPSGKLVVPPLIDL